MSFNEEWYRSSVDHYKLTTKETIRGDNEKKHFEPHKNATDLNIDFNKKFIVINNENLLADIGDILVIEHNNYTTCPCFLNLTNKKKIWCEWSKLYYADEPKFKVGDRVIFNSMVPLKGKYGEIIRYETNNLYLVKLDYEYLKHKEMLAGADCIDLVEEENIEVGDKCKVITYINKYGEFLKDPSIYNEVIIKEINNDVKFKYYCSDNISREWRELKLIEKHHKLKSVTEILYNNRLYLSNKDVDHELYDLVCNEINNVCNKINNNLNNKEIIKTKEFDNKNKNMNLIEFAKNKLLKPEEKLLRKYELKDEDGSYTDTARQIVIDLEAQSLGYKDEDDMLDKLGFLNENSCICYSPLEIHVLFKKYYQELINICNEKEGIKEE